MLALKDGASYIKTASRNYRDTVLRTLITLFVVGLALEACWCLASSCSYERMDSPSTRWFASEKNGSGLTAITSNGRRWRRTDCFKNRRTALDRSSPARANSSSASCLRSESTRICNVDVVISKSFVVQCADSIPNYWGKCNGMHSRFLNSKTKRNKL